MNTRTQKLGIAAIAFAATAVASNAAPRVELNGQPLQTSVSPVVMNGRTLVPMRDIFESLGAQVNYNALTRGIVATRGTSTVNLQIGNRAASVNGQTVYLEQAPIVTAGSTLVPLRFVSEAMGARVAYFAPTQLVSISQSGSAVAGVRTISVPAGAVVPVNLDTDISSATARVGDTFTATVRSKTPGDSEFPAGTRLEGVVTEATAKSGDVPGALALDFRAAILPNQTRIPLQGQLTALDNGSVVQTQGRVMAKAGEAKDNTARNVLIGAGAGFVLGKVIDKNSTITGALGGLAGYVLARRDKDKAADARLAAGTELGVRIDRGISYSDETYADTRAQYFKM
ncbi:MAG TPA: stalk domain-containing protein [Abditibacteriaceae bacterium]